MTGIIKDHPMLHR